MRLRQGCGVFAVALLTLGAAPAIAAAPSISKVRVDFPEVDGRRYVEVSGYPRQAKTVSVRLIGGAADRDAPAATRCETFEQQTRTRRFALKQVGDSRKWRMRTRNQAAGEAAIAEIVKTEFRLCNSSGCVTRTLTRHSVCGG
jgi:hypothetical protein